MTLDIKEARFLVPLTQAPLLSPSSLSSTVLPSLSPELLLVAKPVSTDVKESKESTKLGASSSANLNSVPGKEYVGAFVECNGVQIHCTASRSRSRFQSTVGIASQTASGGRIAEIPPAVTLPTVPAKEISPPLATPLSTPLSTPVIPPSVPIYSPGFVARAEPAPLVSFIPPAKETKEVKYKYRPPEDAPLEPLLIEIPERPGQPATWMYFFRCPGCSSGVTVQQNQINCKIFRCGEHLNPHASQRECAEAVSHGRTNGCGVAFTFDGTGPARISEYV